MDINVEKHMISSSIGQPDHLASHILRKCLYMMHTVSEFKNLTYRVTKTKNDMEALVIYREGVLGVFGPPVDPITLTLDPAGRCLLTILFKPVQRVCILSPEDSQIDIASLLVLLRLIAGKGFLFCPGLPEKFLAGKVCSTHVVLLKVPFKRYQSAECPVYYQAQSFQPNTKRPSLCALCPRCIHAAKLIQAQPNAASSSVQSAIHPLMQLPAFGHLKPADQQTSENTCGSKIIITQSDVTPAGSPVVPDTISKLLSIANSLNNLGTSVSNESLVNRNSINKNLLVTSGVDVNGNSQAIHTVQNSHKDNTPTLAAKKDVRNTSMDQDIQNLKTLLTKLLQDKTKNSHSDLPDISTKFEETKTAHKEIRQANSCHLNEATHQEGHGCHLCRKQFSTHTQLMTHIKRHEAIPGLWQKKFRDQRQRKSSFKLRGLRAQSTLNKIKSSNLSETTIRLFLKCLNEIILPQNGAAYLKQHKKTNVHKGKVPKYKIVKKDKCAEESQFVSLKRKENKETLVHFSNKRTSSGLSPMQTLLEAAAIADVDHAESKNFLSSSHKSFTTGNYEESTVESSQTLSNSSTELSEEFSIPHKKPRKSSRLASKLEKKKKKLINGGDNVNSDVNETTVAADVSSEQSLLTNLNLLSTVSLETAMKQAPVSSQKHVSIPSSIPLTVLSLDSIKRLKEFQKSPDVIVSSLKDSSSSIVHPDLHLVSASQKSSNNTHGSNIVFNKAQINSTLGNNVVISNSQLNKNTTGSNVLIGNSQPYKNTTGDVLISNSQLNKNTTGNNVVVSNFQNKNTTGDVLISNSQLNKNTTGSNVVISNSQINKKTTGDNSVVSNSQINNTSGGNVVISQSQETPKPTLISTNIKINSLNLPSLPPFLFAGETQLKKVLLPSSSQSHLGQPQTVTVSISPSILRNLVTGSNSQQRLTTETREIQSSNSSCGAMDLSKPKLPQAQANNSMIEKGFDLNSLSTLPHNIAQLVAGSDNPSEVLQCFLMMTKSASMNAPEAKDIKPIVSPISDKQSDSELQARMFASASNYRIDKTACKSQQVHSVISSTSRPNKAGKGVKPSDSSPMHTDEIQCGYKWSGSGGSVKERTQMVRELVPSDVMANLLTKTPLSALSQSNPSRLQQLSPQFVQSSGPERLDKNKLQDGSVSELALNLITLKSSESLVSKKVTPGRIEVPPASIQEWSSPGSTKSIFKTSGILNQLKVRLSNSATAANTNAPHKLQIKNFSQISCPSPTSFSTTTNSPLSINAISSPSLAAILRQPATMTYESNHSNVLNISFGCLASAADQNSNTDSSVLIIPPDLHIKTESVDSYNSPHETVIMDLPVKDEVNHSDVEMADNDLRHDMNSSPPHLIVDMGSSKNLNQGISKKFKSFKTAPSVSSTSELTKKNRSVKYERRKVLF